MPGPFPTTARQDVATPQQVAPPMRARLAWGWRVALVLALLWAMLAGVDAWAVGLAVALAGAGLGAWLVPGEPHPWRPWRLLPFGWYFLRASLAGGVDVARRALRARTDVAPCFARHAIGVPPGQPRTLVVALVGLLPGTLSADLDPDSGELLVHALAPEALETLDELESQVALLFGLELPGRGAALRGDAP